MCRRAVLPPGAGSRDRKWSYSRLDDVTASPTTFDSRRRRLSSPTLDYDNIFDQLDTGAIFSSFDFDRGPVHQSAARQNTVQSDDNVSVVWNPDKSVTMSLPLHDNVANKENRMPTKHGQPQQQPQQQRRYRNESFMMISSASPAESLSRSLLHHQMWTPRPVTPPPQHSARSAADLWLSRPTAATDLSKFGAELSPQVIKMISPPLDADTIDSLSPAHLSKRKSEQPITFVPAFRYVGEA